MVTLEAPTAVSEMFRYLSAETPKIELVPADGAFVFGRGDQLLSQEAARLYRAKLVQWVLFTGGFGKDSAADSRVPEAIQLAHRAWLRGLAPADTLIEPRATNGGENVRLGLDLITSVHPATSSLIVGAHATSVRRLVMMLEGEISVRGLDIQVQSVATPYEFKPWRPKDALEAAQEIIRMADWPRKYGYPENTDLDPDLVALARAIDDAARSS